MTIRAGTDGAKSGHLPVIPHQYPPMVLAWPVSACNGHFRVVWFGYLTTCGSLSLDPLAGTNLDR